MNFLDREIVGAVSSTDISLVRKVQANSVLQANSVGYDDVVSVVFLLTKNSKVTCVTAST
jgi:hypothetical protein